MAWCNVSVFGSGTEASVKKAALIFHALGFFFIKGLSCALSLTKIMWLISIQFDCWEESHETILGTSLKLPDTVFPMFGSETEASDQIPVLVLVIYVLALVKGIPSCALCLTKIM